MKDNNNGRTKNATLNILWMVFSQVVTTVLNLVSRKFFLEGIGAELLGLSSLFADILIIFSFADLGIGTAIAFCLYKPIADQDDVKIQQYLSFLKKFYRVLILVLLGLSGAFIPFLLLLNTEVPFVELLFYYLLYLSVNIVSYFWVYKETYVIACQNERKITIFNSVFTIIQISFQILMVKLFANYYLYLAIAVAVMFIKKVVLNYYITKKYPITALSNKKISKLDDEDKKQLFSKSKSMVVHKIGNLAINQTDSLLISTMINVSSMGLVSNYLVIKNTIVSVTSRIYTSVLPSMGNLVVKENEEKQLRIFGIYDFLNYWLSCFCFVALAVLSTPFIDLFFGKDYEIGKISVILLCAAFLIDSLRSPVSMLREASGEYERDKWFTIVAAVVNLGVSVLCVFLMGLPGIYIGTISAMVVLIVSRTYLLFKHRYLSASFWKYMLRIVLYLSIAFGIYFLVDFLCGLSTKYISSSLVAFIVDAAIVLSVTNIVLFVIFFKTKEFKSVFHFLKSKIRRRAKANE